jgi:hypothetical protein
VTTTTLYLSNGQPLQFKKGLPPGYHSIYIPGAQVFHAASRFGLVVTQYITVNGLIFECLYIKWNMPETIFCVHEYPAPVLSTRIITKHPLQETLKGAGKNDFTTNQFASVTGVNWTSLLRGPEAPENISFRAVWPGELIVNELNGHQELRESIENPVPLVPDAVPGPLFKADDTMLELVDGFINSDYSRPRSWFHFAQKMMELFALVKNESIERASVKTSEDWKKISCVINLLILAILDYFVPGKPLSSVVTKGHVMAGFLSIFFADAFGYRHTVWSHFSSNWMGQ